MPATELLEWFKNPTTSSDYNLNWKPLDQEKVLKVLVDKHEFRQERIQNQLDALAQATKNGGQTGLSKYF